MPAGCWRRYYPVLKWRLPINIEDLKRVNRLWRRLYPYLVAQIMEGYRRDSGKALELGPFSGGISLELARLHPGFDITIAAETAEVVRYLEEEIKAAALAGSIKVRQTELNHLSFASSRFDLIVFRGAFFFLPNRQKLLPEIFRLLRDGGMAFVGGGYGKGVPQPLIDEIADESRRLNDRLGRRWLSIKELEDMVAGSGLAANCKISQEGGVWLNIRK